MPDDPPFDLEALRRERARKRAIKTSQDAEQLAESRMLFSDEEGNPCLRESFAVYIDALGTKEGAQDLTNDELRRQIELLDELTWFLHDDEWEGEFQRLLSFSDNVVLGVPLIAQDLGGYGLGLILPSLAAYQLNMAVEGRFHRGAIAEGDLYIDRGFVAGPALVDAVEHEARVAVYPRILLTEACAERAIRDARTYRTIAESPWNGQLLVDADGQLFVDYLVALTDSPAERQVLAGLRAHHDAVQGAVMRSGSQPRVADKYRWVVAYHNFTCRRWGLEQAVIARPGQPLGPFDRVFRTLADCLD